MRKDLQVSLAADRDLCFSQDSNRNPNPVIQIIPHPDSIKPGIQLSLLIKQANLEFSIILLASTKTS